MGTKLEELQSGSFHAALPDEPMFVLLARDPQAPVLVKRWADDRAAEIYAGKRPASDMDKVTEARECARRMTEWRDNNDGAWRTGLFAPPQPDYSDEITDDQIDAINRLAGKRHVIRQENDEYACSCGARWDVSEGEQHP